MITGGVYSIIPDSKVLGKKEGMLEDPIGITKDILDSRNICTEHHMKEA